MPALLMAMPYTAIQFTVLHKLKTLVSGSSKSGVFLSSAFLSNTNYPYLMLHCNFFQNRISESLSVYFL